MREINQPTYGQLTYGKGSKNIQWRKVSLFSKWCWETGQLHVKDELSLTPYLKQKTSQWIINLNVTRNYKYP